MQGLEWIVMAVVIGALLFFGPTKIPALARSIGRTFGELKRGRLEIEEEIRALNDGRQTPET